VTVQAPTVIYNPLDTSRGEERNQTDMADSKSKSATESETERLRVNNSQYQFFQVTTIMIMRLSLSKG